MRHLSSLVPSSACAAIVALFSFSAAAHIELVEPSPRYPLPGNKSCPCGDGPSDRRCMVSAAESSDPARSTNVQTFEAGSTITVVADEYIDHAGRMRVAFDPDGADLADFNDNILLDVPDPGEAGLSMANPRVWEFQIQLPNMTCDNCTLQVVQVMNNNTTTPVMDPAPLSTYYTCADIRLVPPGSLEAGGGDGSAGTANAGEADGASGAGSGGTASAGVSGAAGTGGAQTSAGTGGAQASAGNGGEGDESPPGTGGTVTGAAGTDLSEASSDDDEEGRSCTLRRGARGSSSLWALLLLGLAAAHRRRR